MAKRARYLHEHKLWLENIFDNEEPQACEYKSCKEWINGLNFYWVMLAKDFSFHISLCEKHAKLLEKRIWRSK